MKTWSQHQIDCLNVMGITQWKNKNKIESVQSAKIIDPLLFTTLTNNHEQSEGIAQNSVFVPKDDEAIDSSNIDEQPKMENWQNVQDDILNCQSCTRCEKRQQAIVGEGNKNTHLMIITDAPAESDDKAGKMYSGEVGLLFSKMLNAIDINLDNVYITPFVKCFQVNSLSVQKDEFEHCLLHLQQQINLIKPSLILIFSENAAQLILKNQSPLNTLRQQVHLSLNQTKTIVTYSPSLILADGTKKRDIWEDLKFAKKTMAEHGMHV